MSRKGPPADDPPPCPICEGPVAATAKTRPFCSAQCRWIDLGRWLDGSYAIPGEEDAWTQPPPPPEDEP